MRRHIRLCFWSGAVFLPAPFTLTYHRRPPLPARGSFKERQRSRADFKGSPLDWPSGGSTFFFPIWAAWLMMPLIQGAFHAMLKTSGVREGAYGLVTVEKKNRVFKS